MAGTRRKSRAARRRSAAKRQPLDRAAAISAAREDQPGEWRLAAALVAIVLLVGTIAGTVIYHDKERQTLAGMIDRAPPAASAGAQNPSQETPQRAR